MTKVETSAVTDPLLLPTRLFVPVLDPEIVSRDRLLDLLQSASSTRLLLVSAPAGSGKTTLVADWVRRGHRPAAWLSMEAVEADAASFVGGLVEAVGGLAPAASAPARALMASAPPPEPRTIAMALATGLATAAIRATVVLDDYHVVSDPVSHEILTLLIERVPHGLQLVLITRSDPPLPLARMRARRQLREVRAADLRFTDEESARFIAHYCRQDLTSEEVATLTERTEGWAAGLQLAGLALRQAADPGRFVAGFKGTHTYVADFLTDEVLAGIPVEDQRFLVRTSLLRRFTGALCDAALERSGSQPLLESLNRANLFLVPLDAERRWFRFHHLFGDLLRRRALEEPADLRRALLARASRWCDANGAADDAVGYAMEAGETTKAADLVARHGIAALAAGEALRALHWIRLLPNDIVRSSPDHCVIAAWSHSLVEQYDAIAGYASRALESLGEGQRPFTYVGHVELHVRALLAGAAHLDGQDPRGTLRMLDEVLAATPADDLLLRASVAIMRGKVLAFDGRYEEGIAAHGQAHACGERAGSELLQMAACTGKAEALLLQGRLREAIAVADQELEDGSGATEILGSQVANLHAIMSLAYLERNELDRCEAAVGRAAAAVGVRADSSRAWSEIVRLGKVRFTAFHSTSPRALYALAARLGLLRRRGRNDEADRLLKQVETAAGSSISVATSQILHTLRHRLRHGRREGLKRPPRTPSPEHGIDVPTGCSYWDVATSIARARSLLESGDATSAEAELARTTLQDREPNLAHAEALVLRARILVALARRAEAERAVDAALEASAPEHRAGVWTDAGEAAIPLLESAVARGCAADEALSFASRVLVMLRQQAPASAEAASSASLSERELAVLRLLAAGRNNREIADALFLAIGTVKKHTHNIYGKLQVTSRTQAILAGRRQGIIA